MELPKSLTRICIAGLILMLAACASSGNGRSVQPTSLQGASLPAAASQQAQSNTPLGRSLLAAINAYRSAPNLASDPTLQRAAAVHAKDMALRNYQSHHSPEGLGPHERVLAVDTRFQGRVAENIWGGTALPGKSDDQMAAYILQGWNNSPRHRTTLESSAYSRTGIGVARKGNVIYVVQLFAE